MRSWRSAVGLVLVVVAVSACGDSGSGSPTAAEQVCDARSALESALQTVVDDVQALNLGQAKDDLPSVTAAAGDLAEAVKDLAEEERAAVQPEVEALTSTLGSLDDATSLQDLSGKLDEARSQWEAVLADVGTTVDCGS